MKRQTTSPAKIKAYAKSIGVEFDYGYSGHQYSVECWSPEGKRWANHGTHFVSLEGDGYYTTPDWQKTTNRKDGRREDGNDN
jgi:hypothetical protein